MKLYAWNVNGIRAIWKKGFKDWLQKTDPDILFLQETKASVDQLEDEILKPEGYHTYWASAERKGYSGVALFSKIEPKSVKLGLDIPEYDTEGRTIVAEYDDFVLMGAYFPNGGRDLSRVPYKMSFKKAFLDHCDSCRNSGKSVIFCGDVNTAHREIDLARPKENVKTTGFLPEERAWIDEVVGRKYVDVFRHLHPDVRDVYSWWSNRTGARERNIGWRIDYFFVSDDLLPRVEAAEIHCEVMGSDHCPISLTLK